MNKLIATCIFLIPFFSYSQSDSSGTHDSLQGRALFLEPVEVRAIRAADNAPFTKTTVTSADIRAVNLGQDIPFILNQTPSVVISSDAGNGIGYTGIRIRGSDASRINMTLNGIPYNDAESQALYFVDLPDLASSVHDVQIQRGIGTSSNGAGAFGATMNFTTNEVITRASAEVNNSVGSYNSWKHTVKVSSGLLAGHFTVDARLSRISSDGYVDRASADLRSLYLSGAYITANSSIRLNILSGHEKTYQAWNGITAEDLKSDRRKNYSGTEKPGDPYANETDNYQQDHAQLFFNHRLHEGLDINTALFYTPGKGYYENYKASQSFGAFGLPNPVFAGDTVQTTDLVRQLWLDNKFFGQILSLQYHREHTSLTVGGGWSRYNGQHYGEVVWADVGFPSNYRYYQVPAHKSDINAYAKFQYRLAPGLETFTDVQYRYIDYYLGGFEANPQLMLSKRYNFFNPKAGLSWTRGSTRWYASYAFAGKEPNRDDFEAGLQEQPRPEKMHDVEAGLERRQSAFGWSANIYYMKYRDQLIPTGKINNVGAYTRVNIPDSYRLGIEMQGNLNLREWLALAGNLALSRNKVIDYQEFYDDYDNGGQKSVFHSSADIAFSPAVVAGATVTIHPFDHATIAIPARYVSRQYLDNSSRSDRSLAPYYVQDLRLAYTLSPKTLRAIDFIFQVNNVFSKRYESNGYTYSYQSGGALVTENYYFPMAPANVMFAVNISL